MAERLIVKIVERYLAEHGALLQRDEELRSLLLRVLDIFIAAGWPSALRLTYGLHELFR